MQGIQGYRIQSVTIAPICTDLMDLSGLISFQCRALLVYLCAFFQLVVAEDQKHRAASVFSLSALFISTSDNLVLIFFFFFFLNGDHTFFCSSDGTHEVNLFKDVSKRRFHIVQCRAVLLALLFQSASYLLCHHRAVFGKFPT